MKSNETTTLEKDGSQKKKLTTIQKVLIGVAIAVVAVFVIAPEYAQAGTGGTEFDDVWTTLKDWSQGTLGRIIAGSMMLVGIVAGIARQNLMSLAMGIGGGLGMYNGPGVIESVMSATIETASVLAPAAINFSNGLGM